MKTQLALLNKVYEYFRKRIKTNYLIDICKDVRRFNGFLVACNLCNDMSYYSRDVSIIKIVTDIKNNIDELQKTYQFFKNIYITVSQVDDCHFKLTIGLNDTKEDSVKALYGLGLMEGIINV